MNTATLRAAAPALTITGPVKYLNRNWTPTSGAGHWLFGWRVDRQIGFRLVWTDDEATALTDNGEIAAMLGLGTGQPVSVNHFGDGGYASRGACLYDSILEALPSDAPPISNGKVRLGNARKGGWKDAHRDADGATLKDHTCN